MKRGLKSKLGLWLSIVLLSSMVLPVMAVPAAAAPSGDPYTVTIDPGETVQSDFLGIGVNVIPTALMPGSTQYGYTEAHWEMDRKRILTVQPKIARVWFQIDWMEREKGVYDFDSLEMEALYKYLDAFKDAGTDIELNFGWKVGEDVHDWFTIPGVDPWTSAPADLDAYAVSASTLLQELFDRGYDNVKYLTFYNEPNGNWDFEAPGDQQAYYAEMARRTSQQLTEDGLRDRIEIWGPEETGAPLWTKYMKDNADDVFDGYTFHVYGESYVGLGEAFELRQSYVGDKPIHLTEFGWADDDASNWDAGYANSVIQAANMGVQSALMWQLNGVWSYDPYGDTSGTYTMWDSLLYGLEARKTFYSVGMLMRYIPEHSEVLKVTTSSDDHIRAAAFRDQNGEYTILLEAKEGSEKEVTFDFSGVDVDKTFRKFVYQDDVVRNGQALLPASEGSFEAGTSFTDGTIDSAYNVVIYTTAAPQTQVEVNPLNPTVSAGETVLLTANVIDNAGGVEWSVLGSGNGTIDATGMYTPPAVDNETVVAIKAQSVADPDSYAIALVNVRPASSPDRAETPTIALESGVYDQAEAVYIESETEGARIYYTTNGETPTEESSLYTGAVVLEEGKTVLLQAIAVKDGLQPSGVTSALYKVLQNGKGPDGYTFCMYDNGDLCQLEQPASVAYGADGLFNYITTDSDVACTSASFGGDPIPGAEKRCYYSYEIPEELPLATIYNAGFEKPNTSGTVVGPTTNGWTFNSRAGIQSNASPFNPAPAPEGDQSAYLKTDGGVAGEISQDIYFKPGTYQLEFQAAKRTDFGGTQTFDVYFDDIVIGSYAADTGEYRKFRTESFAVSETSKHTIRFAATTTEGDNTAFLDAVRITHPVEPAAPYLVNAGFEQPSAAADADHVLEHITAGWTFETNAGIVRNDNALSSPAAPTGVQAAFLKTDGNGSGSFEQTAAFPEGTYAVGFRAALAEVGSQTIDLYAGDTLIDSVELSGTGYRSYETVFFTVAEGDYPLRFSARSTDPESLSFVDSVSIEKIIIPDNPALSNGSFETPEVTSGSGVLVGGNSGWSFNNYSGTVRNGSVFEAANAPDGTQIAYLQTIDENRGAFSQSIVFPAGRYVIEFQAAKRTSFGGQQSFAVYLDDRLLGNYTPSSGSFASFATTDFEIESPSKREIRFEATTTSGDNTAFIDAIEVVPYTEPTISVDNAGFEAPVVTSEAGTMWNMEAGWLFNTHAGIARNGSVFGQSLAPEGGQVGYLLTDGSGRGAISQSVELPEGTYTMNFYAARRDFGVQPTFEVSVDDQVVGTIAPTGTSFRLFHTSPFTVTGGSHTVKFVAVTEGDSTAFVDAVGFEPYVPPVAPVADNTGFEAPEIASGTGTVYNIEAGWVFNSHAGMARNGSVFEQADAPEGSQVAYLLTDAGGRGEISQSVEFPAGTFTIGFQAARRGYGGQQSINVMVDDQVVGSVTPTSTSFELFATDPFTVTAGKHAVKFVAATTEGDNTAFIDAVAFEEHVPPAVVAADNAGFETPEVDTSYGTVWNIEAGWQFNSHAGIARNGSVLEQSNAPEGSQVAYLLTDAGGRGEISQSIEFPAGTFTINFQAARRSYGGQQSIHVIVDDQVVGTVTPTSTSFGLFETSPFTVTAGNHAVKFAAATTEGDNTAFIDAVAFEEYVAPEIPAAANTGFESPEIASGTGTVYNIESGWVFNSHAGMARNGSVFDQAAAPEGSQVAYLLTDGGGRGQISQSIEFPAGTFTISFQAARRGFGGQQIVDVMVDDRVVGTVTPTSTSFGLFETEPFAVSAGYHVVKFVAATTEGDNTAFLDEIAFHKATADLSVTSIAAFAIEGQIGASAIDAETHTVTVTMPFGSDIGSLVPTIGVADGATVSPSSGIAQDFRNGPVTYTVTAADGVTNQAWVVIVNVADLAEISTQSRISSGATNPSVTISVYGDTFVSNLTTAHFTVLPGTTNLVLDSVTGSVYGSEASLFFVGTAEPGTLTVSANAGAFDGTSSGSRTIAIAVMSSDANIYGFSLPGQIGSSAIDADEGTVLITMPHDANLGGLTPNIDLAEGASIAPGAGTARDFGNGAVTYTVTAEDGSVKQWTVTVSRAPAPSSPSSSSDDSEEQIETIPVDPDAIQVPNGTVARISIVRSAGGNGVKSDSIELAPNQAADAAARANEAGAETVVIFVPEQPDEVSETTVRLPLDAVRLLAEGNLNASVVSPNGEIMVRNEVLAELEEDLYFRIVPVRDELTKNDIESRAQSDQSLGIAEQRQESLQVIGQPRVIESNIANRPVTLTLPLSNADMPTDEAERERFLRSLYVYIEHSDGEKVLVKPALIEPTGSGTYGLQFEITKFSTFSVVSIEEAPVPDRKSPYMSGYPDGTFRPEGLLTRAEMAAILSRLSDVREAAAGRYADLPAGHWAGEFIDRATSAGWMSGYGDGTFRPGQAITRAEMASIAARWLGLQGGGDSAFADAAGHWAATAIGQVQEAGLMNGYADRTFRPDQPITRAETTVVINGLLGLTTDAASAAEPESAIWPDVPSGHWAYRDILNATAQR